MGWRGVCVCVCVSECECGHERVRMNGGGGPGYGPPHHICMGSYAGRRGERVPQGWLRVCASERVRGRVRSRERARGVECGERARWRSRGERWRSGGGGASEIREWCACRVLTCPCAV